MAAKCAMAASAEFLRESVPTVDIGEIEKYSHELRIAVMWDLWLVEQAIEPERSRWAS